MMDEIDAHLDVVNSQKLAELLKSKSKGSQFIIVSLKDVTISRADSGLRRVHSRGSFSGRRATNARGEDGWKS